MSETVFRLPDVGEGLTEAEIVSWKVKAGEEVTVNQVLVEIETAKSLVELPSPFEGQVAEILVDEGTTVEVGSPIIRVEASGQRADTGRVNPVQEDVTPPPGDRAASAVQEAERSDPAPAPAQDEGSGANLVGYGTKPASGGRRKRRQGGGEGRHDDVRRRSQRRFADQIIAKPPIRKLARDLDVDLAKVDPTGQRGEITRDDVLNHAKQASVFKNITTPEWAEQREELIPVKGVRKHIAQNMVRSKFTAPHVSLFVDVDATRTMEYVKRLKNAPDFVGVKVSPLLVMAKAIIWAVRRNPSVNASWGNDNISIHHYVNLGIAAATPRGLIVPNIKEAQSMSLLDLAKALENLTLTAREGKTSPADQQNGTITITNIGVFGMDTGTPVLNPGEVAIIALGTIKQKPWVVDGEVRPRYVTTVGASFDHRVVDGDVASRFLADVASIIEEPALLLD